MNIELKKIYTNERFSEETNCFQADLYCDGKKVGVCENDGQGGCTSYQGIEKYHSDDIKRMEEYCKSLPPHKSHDFELDMNLELYIDLLLEKHLNEKDKVKFKKKMEKDMLIGILEGTPERYGIYSWGKPKIPIQAMLMSEKGKKSIKDLLVRLRGEGKTILNTNIPNNL